ncbi:hypothetical protein [Halorussus sp. AFM4]|uniref:hypothetical protein n=1 Tax=Halorussus sp. AFM4 TaxID=3421651 RepID=UPI003EC154CD
MGLESVGATPIRGRNQLPLLFSAFIGGNLTLITVVLSINQLVLSRQLEAPGTLRRQLQDMAEFRDDAAEVSDRQVMPPLPPDFMHQLRQTAQRQAKTLEKRRPSQVDLQSQSELRDFVAKLNKDFEEISSLLEQPGVHPFHALTAVLDTDIGLRIHQARRLKALYHEEFPEEVREEFAELITVLELIDVSRDYFKTIFMQRELSYLSRVLLYVGFPAELVATVMFLVFDTSTGSAASPLLAPVVVPAAISISFAPSRYCSRSFSVSRR